MKKGSIHVIFAWGIFLLILGILMDDFTTLILFGLGLSILETNPVYTTLGLIGFHISSILIYGFMAIAWYWMVKNYHMAYKKRYVFYKMWDIFVFLFCVVLVTLTTHKVELGFSNIKMITDYTLNDDKKMEMDQGIEAMKVFKKEQPKAFKKEMTSFYFKESMNINVYMALFNTMIAYILFRRGYQVKPWDLNQV